MPCAIPLLVLHQIDEEAYAASRSLRKLSSTALSRQAIASCPSFSFSISCSMCAKDSICSRSPAATYSSFTFVPILETSFIYLFDCIVGGHIGFTHSDSVKPV